MDQPELSISDAPTTVKYDNRHYEVKLQWIRRHLAFPLLLAAIEPRTYTQAVRCIRDAAERLPGGTTITLGYVRDNNTWLYATSNRKHPGCFEAASFLAENHYHYPRPMTIRISKGAGRLIGLGGYEGSLTILWQPNWQYVKTIEQSLVPNDWNMPVNLRKAFPEEAKAIDEAWGVSQEKKKAAPSEEL